MKIDWTSSRDVDLVGTYTCIASVALSTVLAVAGVVLCQIGNREVLGAALLITAGSVFTVGLGTGIVFLVKANALNKKTWAMIQNSM